MTDRPALSAGGVNDFAARCLYEVMEEISDDPPGPDWDALTDGERDWYYLCIGHLSAKGVTLGGPRL